MRVDTPPSFLLSPQPRTGQLCQRMWRSEEAEGQSSLFQGLDPSSGMTAGPTGELLGPGKLGGGALLILSSCFNFF